MLTLSRAGFVAALVIAVVLCVGSRERRREIATTLLGGITLGFGTLAAVSLATTGSMAVFLHLFLGVSDVAPGGVGTRAQLWHAALVLWRRHPWLGVGAGNFELELGRVGLGTIQTHANSWYLQALAEGGVVLFAATLALIVAALLVCRPPRGGLLGLAVFAGTLGLALHQIVDDLVFYPKVGDLWWIALALAVVARERATNPALAKFRASSGERRRGEAIAASSSRRPSLTEPSIGRVASYSLSMIVPAR